MKSLFLKHDFRFFFLFLTLVRHAEPCDKKKYKFHVFGCVSRESLSPPLKPKTLDELKQLLPVPTAVSKMCIYVRRPWSLTWLTLTSRPTQLFSLAESKWLLSYHRFSLHLHIVYLASAVLSYYYTLLAFCRGAPLCSSSSLFLQQPMVRKKGNI
jgi:hypothetical protein